MECSSVPSPHNPSQPSGFCHIPFRVVSTQQSPELSPPPVRCSPARTRGGNSSGGKAFLHPGGTRDRSPALPRRSRQSPQPRGGTVPLCSPPLPPRRRALPGAAAAHHTDERRCHGKRPGGEATASFLPGNITMMHSYYFFLFLNL